jgi:hypothetical protein
MGATNDLELARGDTSTREFILEDPEGDRFDPTGFTLSFFLELKSVTPAGSSPQTGAGTFVIVDGPNGVVSYTFAAADTAVAGVYRFQIEAFNTPQRETFPQDGYLQLESVADLGDG